MPIVAKNMTTYRIYILLALIAVALAFVLVLKVFDQRSGIEEPKPATEAEVKIVIELLKVFPEIKDSAETFYNNPNKKHFMKVYSAALTESNEFGSNILAGPDGALQELKTLLDK